MQGYFFIALGKKYIEECSFLVNTIRKNNDNRPVSLLIHPNDEEYAKSFKLYDKFIHFSPNDDLSRECNKTSFEKYCLYPRLKFNEYLPYDETIIVDSDVLCQYSTEHVWTYLTNQSYPIRMLGRWSDLNWHWGTISEVIQQYGKHIPHTHGGFFYFRKDPFLKVFFDYCEEVFYKYDHYKCKRYYQNGRVDEIIFAIAHSKFNLLPIPFDEYPIMTFEYKPDMEFPTNIQTESKQNFRLNGYPPFIHMFDKMDGPYFKTLYQKITNEI